MCKNEIYDNKSIKWERQILKIATKKIIKNREKLNEKAIKIIYCKKSTEHKTR